MRHVICSEWWLVVDRSSGWTESSFKKRWPCKSAVHIIALDIKYGHGYGWDMKWLPCFNQRVPKDPLGFIFFRILQMCETILPRENVSLNQIHFSISKKNHQDRMTTKKFYSYDSYDFT